MTLPPREFITAALSTATDTFQFFDAIVGRMEADAARIAELEGKDKTRTRELITWIEIAVGPKDGMTANLAAKAKIETLQKELE